MANKQQLQTKENRGKVNKNNLMNMAPLLYDTIERYEISKMYLAKQLYLNEWDEEDQPKKHKLTINLRNKLNGTGKLEKNDLIEIQNILLEMSDTIKSNVEKTIVLMERNEKIEKIAKFLEGKSDEEINNIMNQI